MKIETQDFFDLVEATGRLAIFDIEASGLKSDYNSILVASVKPFHRKPVTFSVDRPGDDRTVIKNLRDELEKYLVIVGYYSKGFDIPMLRGRLLQNNMTDIKPLLHLDMYFGLKAHVNPARRSQAHISEWLDLEHKKLTLSPQVWNDVLARPARELPKLVKRCEADVVELEDIYSRCRHLIREVKK
jgi:uncharacterized protein YprB with RNaseH-like and TPR domain